MIQMIFFQIQQPISGIQRKWLSPEDNFCIFLVIGPSQNLAPNNDLASVYHQAIP